MSQAYQVLESMANSTVLNDLKQTYLNNRIQKIAIAVGAAVLTPIMLPLLKPVAKATIKSGVALFEKTKGAVAETGEFIGDIVAEAKAEVAAERVEKAQKAGLLKQAIESEEATE